MKMTLILGQRNKTLSNNRLYILCYHLRWCHTSTSFQALEVDLKHIKVIRAIEHCWNESSFNEDPAVKVHCSNSRGQRPNTSPSTYKQKSSKAVLLSAVVSCSCFSHFKALQKGNILFFTIQEWQSLWTVLMPVPSSPPLLHATATHLFYMLNINAVGDHSITSFDINGQIKHDYSCFTAGEIGTARSSGAYLKLQF